MEARRVAAAIDPDMSVHFTVSARRNWNSQITRCNYTINQLGMKIATNMGETRQEGPMNAIRKTRTPGGLNWMSRVLLAWLVVTGLLVVSTQIIFSI